MVEAVKAARRFVQTPAWDDYVTDRFGLIGSAQTDADILEAARKAIVTIWHPSCTARMSPTNATWGVLDPQLRVKGTSGLRVVDASSFVSFFLYYKLRTNVLIYSLAGHSCRTPRRVHLCPCRARCGPYQSGVEVDVVVRV